MPNWKTIRTSNKPRLAMPLTPRVDRGVEIDSPNDLRLRVIRWMIVIAMTVAAVLIIQELTGQRGSDKIVEPGANKRSYPFPWSDH